LGRKKVKKNVTEEGEKGNLILAKGCPKDVLPTRTSQAARCDHKKKSKKPAGKNKGRNEAFPLFDQQASSQTKHMPRRGKTCRNSKRKKGISVKPFHVLLKKVKEIVVSPGVGKIWLS